MTSTYAKNFTPGTNYSSCDVDVAELPVKQVRIILHVFQKNDGSGNIPNNNDGLSYLYLLWSQASDKFRNLQVMTSPTPSPYIPDSKIELREVGIHFWQNTTMWAKGNNTSSNGNTLHQFVMGQNVAYKSNAIHIFIPGNYSTATDGLGVEGIASGIGDKDWSLLEDVYNNYSVDGNFWFQASNLAHEIGHNLGLYHTFQNDRCDDTPLTPYQAWGYDNNMMTYNRANLALTADQITRCHLSLQHDSYVLHSGAQASALSGTVTSNFVTKNLGYTNEVGASTATVSINTSSADEVEWTQIGGSGSFSSSSNGLSLSLSGLTDITFDVEWTNNCIEFSNAYVFYRGYSYAAGPNPSSGVVTVKESGGTYGSSSDASRAESRGIQRISVYDYNNQPVGSYKFSGSSEARIDISKAPAGIVYLVIEGSPKKSVTLKIVKR